MNQVPDTAPLMTAIQRLRGDGVIPGVATRLEGIAADLAVELSEAVVAEVEAFTETGNPEVRPELEQHLAAQVDAIVALLAGGEPGGFEQVLDYAERRAAQKFPLDALLQSCRCIHKILSARIRDAALETANENAHMRRVVAAATDFTLEYVGIVSSLLTTRYVQHTRILAEAEGDRRTALINTLLDGYDESDSQAAKLLKRAGYLEQRQSCCVAVARSVNPTEMQNAARAQRMAEAVASALAPSGLRVVVGLRDNLAVAIISGSRRQSGWTAPQSLLAERIFEPLRTVGTAALIGLSNDAPSTSHIPRAFEEARFALDFAGVADRVQAYARIPFRQILVSHGRDRARAALPTWINQFQQADRRAGGALAKTLKAYADADMNVLKTAKALGLHPNSIYARMQRIEAITGESPTRYHGLTGMLLALECAAER